MAGMAREGHTIAQASKSVSYTARVWDSCLYWDEEYGCSGGWTYPTGTTTIYVNGTLRGASSNVYVNGFRASYRTGGTLENDSWNQPSDYYSGVTIHSNATGTVTAGNTRNVYVNGQLATVQGSAVATHEGVNTTVNQGSSNVRIGG